LVVISGAAHGFMIEHGTTFNRILLEFLARADAAHHARAVDQGASVVDDGGAYGTR
jgi:3-oxoadipate enol-lactonase